jgi:polar amino acid transport system substrate-binding protein
MGSKAVRNRLMVKLSNSIFLLLVSTFVASKPCHLTLGLSNWLPYQAIDSSGKAHGLQVKLLEQIATKAECKLSYRPMTFQVGIKEMKAGKIDFLVNASPSSERQNFAYFSIPYRQEFLLLYSTPKFHKQCQEMSLEDLIRDGFRLAIQEKLFYGEELRAIQNTPELNEKLRYVDNNVQHVELVESEDLDGIVDDPIVVSYRSTLNPVGRKVLKSCPISVSTSPVSFMFSKRTVSLVIVERFNQAIRTIQQTPDYQKQWSW